MALSSDIHARLRQNSVDLARGDLQPVLDAAAKHNVTIVLGLNELDSRFTGTTLFNTVVVIGPDGKILNRHRKLMPTNPERMVWGMGDASGLKVVDTPAGRLGALICWESYMPLARYASMPRKSIFTLAHLGQWRELGGLNAPHREGSGMLGHQHRDCFAGKRHSGRFP